MPRQKTLRSFLGMTPATLKRALRDVEAWEEVAAQKKARTDADDAGAGAGAATAKKGPAKGKGKASAAPAVPFAKGHTEQPLHDIEYADQCYAFASNGTDDVLVTAEEVVALATPKPEVVGKGMNGRFAILQGDDGDTIVELVPKDEKAPWPKLNHGVRLRRVTALEQQVGETLWLDVPDIAPGEKKCYTDGLRKVATAAAAPKGAANIAVSAKGFVWLIEASPEAGLRVLVRIDVRELPDSGSKNESKTDGAPYVALWGGGGVLVIGFQHCRTVYFVGAREGDQLGKVLRSETVVLGKPKHGVQPGILAMAVSETAVATPSVFATTSDGALIRMSMPSCCDKGKAAESAEGDFDSVTCMKGNHAYPFFLGVSDGGIVATAGQSTTEVTLWNTQVAGGGIKKIKTIKAYPKWDRLYQHMIMGVALNRDGTALAVACSNGDPTDLPLHKIFRSK